MQDLVDLEQFAHLLTPEEPSYPASSYLGTLIDPLPDVLKI